MQGYPVLNGQDMQQMLMGQLPEEAFSADVARENDHTAVRVKPDPAAEQQHGEQLGDRACQSTYCAVLYCACNCNCHCRFIVTSISCNA
jgi:hypothetical protein